MIHNLKLSLHTGRQAEDDWEVIIPEDIEFWKQSLSSINQREYLHDSCKVQVNVDWSSVVPKLEQDFEAISNSGKITLFGF